MNRQTTGIYVETVPGGESVRSFVPNPLPPVPALALTPAVQDLLDQAHMELGRLDGMTSILPDTALFLYMYIRKEAVLSSQIEGTHCSLADLLLFENAAISGVPVPDVQDVSNYVSALEYGLKRLRDGFPLCNRLLCEIHETLLAHGRSSEKQPGEFRRSQNWIGGTRPGNAHYVPPPPERLADCLSAFEQFLNNEPARTPTLLKAALCHVQFETIHPFLDGNGRLGRLFITLLLCHEGVLHEPLLYLSLYFKQHRQTYYDLLQRVRTDGDWEAWVTFFLEATRESARQAVSTAARLNTLIHADRARIRDLGRLSGSTYRVFDRMVERPLGSIASVCRHTGLTPNTVDKVMRTLVTLGLVKELTGRKRNRLFSYDHYLRVLSEGTEPLS